MGEAETKTTCGLILMWVYYIMDVQRDVVLDEIVL